MRFENLNSLGVGDASKKLNELCLKCSEFGLRVKFMISIAPLEERFIKEICMFSLKQPELL